MIRTYVRYVAAGVYLAVGIDFLLHGIELVRALPCQAPPPAAGLAEASTASSEAPNLTETSK